ncbi:hypothetical protein H4R18_003106 [Coemansia javaensis]|uniref:Uncharacterized protein n=1 Tax=Coemansia javaensis TaxID=2761396 RepID=A0A9W8HEU6_9FUNG|nr:hypothetical protein H4R18_003106 [Coemansia javaensis]
MFRAPPQPFRRLKILAFVSAVTAIVIVSSWMFASYIDSAAAYANYSTLGLHRVLVVSERPRVERRRAVGRLLRFQGIPFGFLPATRAYDIDHPETRPPWPGEEPWPPVPQPHAEPAALLAEVRTHMTAVNAVVRQALPSALILADAVDVEADIKQRMHDIAPRLPASWDVLFLGHCGARGAAAAARPTMLHPDLYVAAGAPNCTFAYALSYAAAVRLKRVLDNAWPRPQRSFAAILDGLVAPMVLEAYVVDPPLVALALPPAAADPPPRRLRSSTAEMIGVELPLA